MTTALQRNAPPTYQDALATAAKIVAARGVTVDPVAVTRAVSVQIAATRDETANWAKSTIRGLWAVVNPYDAKQVQAFALQAAQLMESAQTAAARVAAAGQSQQLAATGISVVGVASNPLDIRAPGAVIKGGQLVLHRAASHVDYEGSDASAKVVSKAAMSTRGIFERPAVVFRYAQSKGAKNAAALANSRIDSLIDGNLMLAQRLAQQQVLAQAVVDLDSGRTRSGIKIIGYRRIIHPEMSRGGTCGMCIAAADRIYHIADLMPIHGGNAATGAGGCHCTVGVITEDYDPADDLNAVDLNQLYKDAGGTSGAHLKRTRYKVDEHGELGPVLVPQGKYKPRTTKSKVRAGGTALLTDQPAQADIAKQQLGVLETNLAKMRSEGVPEDSSKIAYHLKLISKLQAQLAGQ